MGVPHQAETPAGVNATGLKSLHTPLSQAEGWRYIGGNQTVAHLGGRSPKHARSALSMHEDTRGSIFEAFRIG